MNGTAKLAKLSWLELQADSGTFAKSVGVTPKAYTHRGYDGFKAASTENFIASRTGDRANFVGIMAAQDDQPANATDSGSVLTIALQEAIGTAKKQGSKLTIESLYRDGERNVMSEVGRLRKSRPALEQQPNLFALDKGLLLYELNVGGAPDVEVTERLDPAAEDPLINEWREIADSVTERVEFTVSQNVFPIHPDPTGENSDACDFERYSGSLLSIEVVAPSDGYLNVINAAESEDRVVVMFPNEHQPENKVREGQLVKVPAAGQGWCLPASLPRGKDSEWNLVVALFSSEEVNYCRDGGPGTDAGPLKMLPKWSRPFLPTGKPAFEAAGTKMLLIDRSPSAQ